MNKITSTLAGLAVVATASIAPAFAQGALNTGPGGQAFTFTPGAAGLVTVSSIAPVTFNPTGSAVATTAAFSFMGTLISGSLYSVNPGTFTITPTGGSTFTEPSALSFIVATLPSGNRFVGSIGSTTDGTSFNLTSPVPEASTVVSFGALLALGGLALVVRRKGVKNAA